MEDRERGLVLRRGERRHSRETSATPVAVRNSDRMFSQHSDSSKLDAMAVAVENNSRGETDNTPPAELFST